MRLPAVLEKCAIDRYPGRKLVELGMVTGPASQLDIRDGMDAALGNRNDMVPTWWTVWNFSANRTKKILMFHNTPQRLGRNRIVGRVSLAGASAAVAVVH